MKNRFSKLMVLLIIVTLLIGMGNIVFADGENLGDDVVNSLKSSEDGLMGEGAMTTIEKLSRDIFNIVRYIVIAYLVIKAFSFFSQFSNAGDQPQLKASLKTKLLWTAAGLVLALNFWSIYNFISSTIKLTFN